MADTMLKLRYDTGQSLYTQCEADDGRILRYADLTFVDLEVANWSTYDIPMPESPLGSGRYMTNFADLLLPLGNYTWTHLKKVVGQPSVPANVAVGGGGAFWSGASFGYPPPQSTAFDNLAAFCTVLDPNPTERSFVVGLMDAAPVPEDADWIGPYACATSGANITAKRAITGFRRVTPTLAEIIVGSPFCTPPQTGDALTIL